MKPASQASRLWIVSELYYPEETSTGYILTQIAEGLAARRPVSVLCVQPTYFARGRQAPRHEHRRGVEIHRCRSTRLNKNRLLLRLINLVTVSASLFVQLFWRLRPADRVLVVTNPPLLPFLASLACRLRGARCLLLIHDVYPDVAVAVGLLRQNSWTSRLCQRLVQRLYQRVDRIIVLGRDMRALAYRKLGFVDERVSVIPNWADSDEIHPRARSENRLLAEFDLQDKFVVQYAGNLGRANGLEGLVACAAQMRPDRGVHFLLIGGGAKQAWVTRQIGEQGLTNITLLGHRPRSESHDFLNACDVALISFVPGMAGIGVPSRMYNVLAAGKPIIAVADEDSELALVVREEQIGWVVDPADPAALAEVIREARRQPDVLLEMGRRARRAAEQKYTRPQIIEAYARLLAEVNDAPPQLTRHSLRNTPLEEATLWH